MRREDADFDLVPGGGGGGGASQSGCEEGERRRQGGVLQTQTWRAWLLAERVEWERTRQEECGLDQDGGTEWVGRLQAVEG